MHIWTLVSLLLFKQFVIIYIPPMSLSIFVEPLPRVAPVVSRQAHSRMFVLVKLVGGYTHFVSFCDLVCASVVAPMRLGSGHISHTTEKVGQ